MIDAISTITFRWVVQCNDSGTLFLNIFIRFWLSWPDRSANVKQWLIFRWVVLCKDGDGKIGLRVQSIDKVLLFRCQTLVNNWNNQNLTMDPHLSSVTGNICLSSHSRESRRHGGSQVWSSFKEFFSTTAFKLNSRNRRFVSPASAFLFLFPPQVQRSTSIVILRFGDQLLTLGKTALAGMTSDAVHCRF